MTGALRGMRAALVFLTRIPTGHAPLRDDDWRWASAHLPFAGLVVGAILALVWTLLTRAGSWVQAAGAVTAGLLVTGAFHEDGLADTADAFGGAYNRDKLLDILKDPRVGSFGAAALWASLTLRVVLLARLTPIAPAALVATQCAARTPPVWLLTTMPYVTDERVARSAAVARARAPQTVVATAWPIAVTAVLVAVHRLRAIDAVAMAAAAVLTTTLCAWRFHVRVGGLTGDLLGASEQVCECAMLLALALVA